MNKKVQTFSFNPPINSLEEGKCLLRVNSFECTSSVFNITLENSSFSVAIPGHSKTKSAEKTIDELNKFLELRAQNGIDLHVEQIRKKRLILFSDYFLSSFGTFKNEILKELKKKLNNDDVKDLVYGFQLPYDEISDILDLYYIPTKGIGYSLNPGTYEVADLNNNLNYILTGNVKVSVTIDDVRLKLKLKINQTLNFTQKFFFLYNFGFHLITFLSVR